VPTAWSFLFKGGENLKTKPTFSMKMFGVRFCESYCCPVSGCGLDCGDEGTLARHIKRMHPQLCIHEEPLKQDMMVGG
jgi:hypothetical protein